MKTFFSIVILVFQFLEFSFAQVNIIYNDITAQNNKNKHAFLLLRSTDDIFPESRTIFSKIFKEYPNNNLFTNINKAKLMGLKEIPLNVTAKLTNFNKYIGSCPTIKCFYVAIEYELKKENKFYFNGTNFRLYICIKSSGRWFVREKDYYRRTTQKVL